MKSSKVSIKTRSTPASLTFKGQATEHTTLKWYIEIVLTRCNSNLQDHSTDCYIGTLIYNYHTIFFAQWCIKGRKCVLNSTYV